MRGNENEFCLTLIRPNPLPAGVLPILDTCDPGH
jgi:hypothetical protein